MQSLIKKVKAPLPLIGWNFNDPRVSKVTVGNALLDGDYKTSWDYFSVPQRLALTNSLAYLKGGVNALPRELYTPFLPDGLLLRHLVHEMVGYAKEIKLKDTIFDREYDAVVPLPSSTGKASQSNIDVANVIGRCFNDIPIEFLVNRVKPMELKSTKTNKSDRQAKDAPRLMHYDSMSLNPVLFNQIKGKHILLYDDVCTWGNTGEAARNLLILAGAAQVDLITIFSTGPLMRASIYNLVSLANQKDILCSEDPDRSKFELEKSQPVAKECLEWKEQFKLKTWHDTLGLWIEKNWPTFVPNDIPFL